MVLIFFILIFRVKSLFIKFPVTPKLISVLIFCRLILTYIRNNNVVNIIIIILESFVKSRTI